MSNDQKPKKKVLKSCLGNPLLSSSFNRSTEKQNEITEVLKQVRAKCLIFLDLKKWGRGLALNFNTLFKYEEPNFNHPTP